MRILYLDLDTLRPDHLGCYGYHRDTSPTIDSVAAEGVRFDNYYCSDAPCLPSRTALMTGRHGIHTGVVNHGGMNADPRLEGRARRFRDRMAFDNLPAWLRWQLDLYTVSISPFAERHAAWNFNAGFREMYNPGQGGGESAEEITPYALDWIARNAAKDNWFLHVNYWDPHTPYRAPEEFGNPFQDEPLPEWISDEVLEQHQNAVGPHCAKEVNMYHGNENPQHPRQPGMVTDRRSLRRLFDGYDCGIRYMDGHIAQLFDALKKAGVYDDLYIIISSDHGENLGELGIYAEHATADHGTCRIPMIVRGPSVTQGHADSGLHYNLDLGPTLAAFFGQEPAPGWDGASYAPALRDGAACGRDYLVLSQCAHVCQRSVRFGDWLYMRTYHDGYHLFPREMLYNVATDPHEQYDLASEKEELCRQAVYYYQQWHDRMMSTMAYDVDPLWTVIREGGPLHARGALKKYCEYLEQTGRGWAIAELKQRHPHEF
jgi:choline-sulfatase